MTGEERFAMLYAPEVHGRAQCFGREASAYAERVLARGRKVTYRLGVEQRDRYGRALAYVYLANGRMFNELLVGEGYAQPLTVPPNVEHAPRFVEAARRARERGRGLWRACGWR